MSLVAEILDRLTGIAIVRDRLGETGLKVDRLADALLDHEKRLIRIETTLFPPGARPPRGGKALPKK
ncbi:MAG: hypothetical protein AB1768_08940 [Pseudomonadota bacterium]|jgi:hypothetical protein